MTQPAPIRTETPSTIDCRACGSPMRLFGVEPHPGIGAAKLESYVCPHCDRVQTLAVPASRRQGKSRSANARHAAAFDAETTRLLGDVFDTAWEKVLTLGRPPVESGNAAAIRESLAKQIIGLVTRGERDSHRLVEEVLRCVRPLAAVNGAAVNGSATALRRLRRGSVN